MIGFNGTGLMLSPTTARWLPQDTLGINGNGQGVYPALREFELLYGLVNQGELYELTNYFNMVSATGTLVATLPKWGANTFQYYNYSGVVVRQPEVSEFFNEEWTTQVRVVLLVRT